MKKNISKVLISVCRYVFLIAFSYILLYPLLYVIVHAFQAAVDYLDPTVQWVSKNFTLDNFKMGIEISEFWKGLSISVLVMVVSALIQVVTCGIAAYGLARYEFKGKKLVMGLLMLNIMLPSTMLILPNYLNFSNIDFLGILGFIGDISGNEIRINILNTPLVFYLPAILGVGFQSGIIIYIYIQFFKSFPKELEEAAWIDGLGPLGTLFRIVVPSSGVVILTTTVLSVIWYWNEYYLPSMYMTDNQPLAVTVYNILEEFNAAGYQLKGGNVVNSAMAVILLFLLPPLVMYLLLQKKFTKSIARSGIVG